MQTIYKYGILPFIEQIKIPSDKILSCITQGNEVVIYAVIDTDNQIMRDFEIKVVGTGHEINFDITNFTFLNTIKFDNGNIIYHVFYRII